MSCQVSGPHALPTDGGRQGGGTFVLEVDRFKFKYQLHFLLWNVGRVNLADPQLLLNIGILICISQLLLCKKSGTAYQWHSTMSVYLAHACAGWVIPAEFLSTSAGQLGVTGPGWDGWAGSCWYSSQSLCSHVSNSPLTTSELLGVWPSQGAGSNIEDK